MSEPATTNPNQAVDLAWAAYRQAYDQATASGASRSDAKERAETAYIGSMPHLNTRDDIRAFIACVAHGMLFDLFWRRNGGELLAAARIAAAALPRERHLGGRPKSLPDPLPESNDTVY